MECRASATKVPDHNFQKVADLPNTNFTQSQPNLNIQKNIQEAQAAAIEASLALTNNETNLQSSQPSVSLMDSTCLITQNTAENVKAKKFKNVSFTLKPEYCTKVDEHSAVTVKTAGNFDSAQQLHTTDDENVQSSFTEHMKDTAHPIKLANESICQKMEN